MVFIHVRWFNVMPELMAMKNIMVLNDKDHHCYPEKPTEEVVALKGDDKKEAEKNKEDPCLWISGLEIVSRKLVLARVVDLSETPFFSSRFRICRRHIISLDHE